MKEKKCSCCKLIKSVNDFHKNIRLKSGLQSSCKECIAKRRKTEKYLKNEIIRLNQYKENGFNKQWRIDWEQNRKMIYNIKKNEAINLLIENSFVQMKFNELLFINNNGDIKKIPSWYSFNKNINKFEIKDFKPQLRVNGYYALSRKGVEYRVHQLVAMYFMNHIPNGHKYVIDHIDGNKLNNHISNLQIIGNFQNLVKGKYYKSKESRLLKYLDGININY